MKVSVLGTGFSSLSAAAYLAKSGYEVVMYEKNEGIGGRARVFIENGFTFDMGPSWYWMPEVFENFFNDHNTTAADHYDLVRLDPSYQVVFEDQIIKIPASLEELVKLFDELENRGGDKLLKFLEASRKKYEVALAGPVRLPGLSLMELISPQIIKSAFSLSITKSFTKYINAQFKNPLIRQILQFPILFLGSTPDKIPSMYSMLNYADIKLGTWYPMGGMHKIIEGMTNVVRDYGVEIKTSSTVNKIEINNYHAESVFYNNDYDKTDIVVAGADYHHVEEKLLLPEYRQYSEKYWDSRELAPSAILMYLGVKGKIEGLEHHNLFFDAPFDQHLGCIYNDIKWPENPLFYISCPSKTDDSVAPAGHENLFVLIPTAPGLLNAEENLPAHYLELVLDRVKKKIGVDLADRIVYKKFFTPINFVNDYNALKGNAYGLANTLRQTHILKPRIRHKKINNLYYTGQLTVPGPGVPPSIISGQIVTDLIKQNAPLL